MSGLLALLDDVAAIAKVAATSVDDAVGQAVKASSKAAGALIDDAAVTPKYVQGFAAARELPIVWGITKGSLFNKLVILLPGALLLSAFAPWLIAPLLMLGGAYLCFEGAEKVWHVVNPADHSAKDLVEQKKIDATLEKRKIKGAIKTDFILSAEIMTITLEALPDDLGLPMTALSLAVAGLMITALVYGAVAVIVKADDVGLAMATDGHLGVTRATGRAIVKGMPGFLKLLLIIGTAAMIWVGGSIILHGLDVMGFSAPYDWIHDVAVAASGHVSPTFGGAAQWFVTAFLDGVVGLIIGAILIPVVHYAIEPLVGLFSRDKAGDVSR
ncbi:DUF808 domain-containing protein [Oceaniglobus indicus]|uniref:DUF808 domain-containing protein n=1 Tax=Oceaniglobus indicus TaxID=2047749 RepID=UPI000C187B4D|nr:DUF808 domain-containing protein [Oceaniglobus indicus]